MDLSPQLHIPGAYHFDGPPATSGPALSAGVFRPPLRSPSASSSVYNLAKSTGSLCSDTSMGNAPATIKRKRSRADAARESAPLNDWSYMSTSPGGVNDVSDDRVAVADSRQFRYTLAGQIDTPGGPPSGLDRGLDESVYSDVDYRRALGPKRDGQEKEIHAQNGGAPDAAGWSAFAMNTIGGVVGKVWDFCTAGAFRGFYAGGGSGYDVHLKPDSTTPVQGEKGRMGGEHGLSRPETDEKSALQRDQPGLERDDASPGFTRGMRDATRRPSAKRRQLRENDELQRNWVMVEEDAVQNGGSANRPVASKAPMRASTARTPQTPRYSAPTAASGRRISTPVSRLNQPTTRPGLARRTPMRVSHTGSPAVPSGAPASFAQPRSPASASVPARFSTPDSVPAATRTSLNPFASSANVDPHRDSPSRPSSSRLSRIPSPAPPSFSQADSIPSNPHAHRRNTSTASTASVTARRRTNADYDAEEDGHHSPRLDPEALQLAARRKAEQRRADAKIDSFTSRLQDMIREGREALGSTVEVGYEMDAGGAGDPWSDDE